MAAFTFCFLYLRSFSHFLQRKLKDSQEPVCKVDIILVYILLLPINQNMIYYNARDGLMMVEFVETVSKPVHCTSVVDESPTTKSK